MFHDSIILPGSELLVPVFCYTFCAKCHQCALILYLCCFLMCSIGVAFSCFYVSTGIMSAIVSSYFEYQLFFAFFRVFIYTCFTLYPCICKMTVLLRHCDVTTRHWLKSRCILNNGFVQIRYDVKNVSVQQQLLT